MKKRPQKDLTGSLKQNEVAVFAVYKLGGANRSVDTEDVAVKCHQLAPHLFSWQKHKDQINLEIVRVNLSNAKKAQNGRLLSGSGREGWRLSSRGLDWIRAREKAGGSFESSGDQLRRSKAGSIDSVRRERERVRVMATDAWQAWVQSRTVELRGAKEIFRVDEYTTTRMAAIKVARLRAMFDADDELSQFLDKASECVLKGMNNER